MEFIDLETQEIITFSDLKQRYKNVSFPENLTEVDFSDFNVSKIITDPVPVYNQKTESLELSEPKLVNEIYKRTWRIIPKTQEVPKTITMRQARLVLLQNNLLESVNNALNNLTGADGEAARIEWEYATQVERDSGLVQSLSTSLNLSKEVIDQLFIEGAEL